MTNSSEKPQAVMLYQLNEFQLRMLPALAAHSNYKVISEEPISSNLFDPALVVSLNDIAPDEIIASKADEETKKVLPEILSLAESKLYSLPHHQQLDQHLLAVIKKELEHGIRRQFYAAFRLQRVFDFFDLRCFVCNHSFLDATQGMIAVARSRNVPTLHLQHGVFCQPSSLRPERADVVAVSDEFTKRSIHDLPSPAPRIAVTGLPFAQKVVNECETFEETMAIRAGAKKALGIPGNAKVLLYAGSWAEGLSIGGTCYVHTLVHSLRDLILTAKDLTYSGAEVHVIVRGHPSASQFEENLAFSSVAKALSFDNFHVLPHQKELSLRAADVVVSPRASTSFLLEALSEGRPFVSLSVIPEIENLYADSLVRHLYDMVVDRENLTRVINELLKDNSLWMERRNKGVSFMRQMRKFGPKEARENIARLIVGLAEHGLDYVERFEVEQGVKESDSTLGFQENWRRDNELR